VVAPEMPVEPGPGVAPGAQDDELVRWEEAWWSRRATDGCVFRLDPQTKEWVQWPPGRRGAPPEFGAVVASTSDRPPPARTRPAPGDSVGAIVSIATEHARSKWEEFRRRVEQKRRETEVAKPNPPGMETGAPTPTVSAPPAKRSSDWTLAIDFGTSFTVAAIRAAAPAEAKVVQFDGEPRMPSMILLAESGELVVGQAAINQADVSPERLEATPKQYLGKEMPIILGGVAVEPVDAVAAVLRFVYEEALRQRSLIPPKQVRLTHPATWEDQRKGALEAAARAAGITEPVLIAEPHAAAIYYTGDLLEVGQHVAVYDLGGGTFDTAILTRTNTGFELEGPPGGAQIAGEDFDQRLYVYLGERLPDEVWGALRESNEPGWKRANLDFKFRVRRAKESLSNAATTEIVLPIANVVLRMTRPELENLLRDDFADTIEELVQTTSNAQLMPADLSAIYLVGGSSRIPLIARLLAERFGDLIVTWGDPKAVVALGAAETAEGRVALETA
jgi:molecular chaperone DnaK (HSP70)